MKRRAFITLLGCEAACPLAARAQQPDRVRRVGFLTGVNADNPDRRASLKAFVEALGKAGWVEGQNIHIEARWGGGDLSEIKRHSLHFSRIHQTTYRSLGDRAMQDEHLLL